MAAAWGNFSTSVNSRTQSTPATSAAGPRADRGVIEQLRFDVPRRLQEVLPKRRIHRFTRPKNCVRGTDATTEWAVLDPTLKAAQADNKVIDFHVFEIVCSTQCKRDFLAFLFHELCLWQHTVLLSHRELLIFLPCRVPLLREDSASLHDPPMSWDFANPRYSAAPVFWVFRKAHFVSPPIIFKIRSVTPFNSASISASSRGGLNT